MSMKEYIKLFQTPTSGDGYKINDIPFTSTVKSTSQNLVCNLENKRLKKVENWLIIENSEIVIPSNEIWYTSSNGQIVVPEGGSGSGSGSGSGYGTGGGPLPKIVSNTYINGKGIMKFAENLTTIGDCAFSERHSLTSIEFPDSVTSIGNWVFDSCESLSSVTIPDSVTSIGEGAFEFCNLTSVTISDSVTSIGDGAFYSCTGLTNAIIDCGTVGENAFSGCTSLTSVTIGDNVTTIHNHAFKTGSELDITFESTTPIDLYYDGSIRYIFGEISDSGGGSGSSSGGGHATVPTIHVPVGYESAYAHHDNGWKYYSRYIVDYIPPIIYYKTSDDTKISNNYTKYAISNEYDYTLECYVLEFENSITSIPANAFIYQYNLSEVVLPNSVTSIGDSAFDDCGSLTSVTLSDSITSIGEYAFSGCGLTSVTIPSSVTSIGGYAFTSDSELDVTILSTTPFTLVNGQNIIYAFGKSDEGGGSGSGSGEGGSLNLKIHVPEGYENTYKTHDAGWEYYAEYIVAPVYVTGITLDEQSLSVAIGETAYLYATVLPNDADNKNITWSTSDSSILAITSSSNTSCTISGVSEGNAVISAVTEDGGYSATCSVVVSVVYVTGITLNKQSTTLDMEASETLVATVVPSNAADKSVTWAVGNPSALTITSGGTITNIYTGSGDTSDVVTATTVDGGYTATCNVTVLAPHAIKANGVTINGYKYNTKSDGTAIIVSGVTYSGDVTIPNSIIYKNYEYSVTSIGYGAFSGCTSLTSVTIPYSVTSIGDEAFSYCSGLTSITIPDSVTSIGNSAFWYCSSLTSVTIPNSVTRIGGSAFSRCTSLTSVAIPNNVTSIGIRAFYGCSGLTSVVIPNSVTSIEEYTFFRCDSLTSVTIGNSVTSIGKSAFYECFDLASLTIGDSVTSIGNDAFWGCTGLTSVTIPNSVRSIGNYAFSSCNHLASISYTGTKSQWNSITKGESWHYYAAATVVHCTDGDVNL